MNFASSHAYLGDASDDEVDEQLLEEVQRSGGLSNAVQQQQQQQPEPLSRVDSASDSSSDEDADQVASSSSVASAEVDGAAAPAKRKGGFISNFLGWVGSKNSKRKESKTRRRDASQSSSAGAPPPAPVSSGFMNFLNRKRAVDKTECFPRVEDRKNRGGVGGVDTNVLAVQFGTLAKDADEVFAGDVVRCAECEAALNHLSVVRDREGRDIKGATPSMNEASTAPGGVPVIEEGEVSPQGSQAVSQDASVAAASSSSSSTPTQSAGSAAASSSSSSSLPAGVALEEGQLLWVCEFCSHANVLDGLQPAEIPTTASRDYVIEPAPDASTDGAEEDALVLFVLDTSGSMCVSTPVAGRLRLRGARATDPSLLAFGDVDMRAAREDVTYVSRLQAVQASVDAQLESLARSHPKRRVGLITFSGDVQLIGDAVTSTPVTIAGDKLHDAEALARIGREFEVRTPIAEARESIGKALFQLEENGPTALGPALATAIDVASRHRGSTIIVCTDGLANVGLGAMDAGQSVTEWYRAQGVRASAAGVTVSVVSIKGDECRLESLGLVAAETGGLVERVDPASIEKKFAAMLEKPLVATNVRCTFHLHAGLEARDQEPIEGAVDEGEVRRTTKLTREIGNVWSDSECSLAYGLRSSSASSSGSAGSGSSPWSHLTSLPFQVQIEFTTRSGMRALRVLTQTQSVTRDREVAERSCRVELVSAAVAQKAASLARRGEYKAARLHWLGSAPMLSRAAAQSATQQRAFSNYARSIDEFDRVMAEQQRIEENAASEEEGEAGAMPLGLSSSSASVGGGGPGAPSAKPSRGRSKKTAMSDESYRVMHQTHQLNSAGLL